MTEEEDKILREKYYSEFKANRSFYVPEELWKEMVKFCKEKEIPQSLFAYMALKKELEDRKFKERALYCEPM